MNEAIYLRATYQRRRATQIDYKLSRTTFYTCSISAIYYVQHSVTKQALNQIFLITIPFFKLAYTMYVSSRLAAYKQEQQQQQQQQRIFIFHWPILP